MFRKVLVANRAAAASRVVRALRQLGIASVAVYSEADRDLAYVAQADEAFWLGPAPARQSYLDIARILEVARGAGADAIHPGYGFLAENHGFASAVAAAGLTFIGPAPAAIEALGRKDRARSLMREHGMPMVPSTDILPREQDAALASLRGIGLPVMIKPAAGGGGIGMLSARSEAELVAGLAKARSMAERSFGNDAIYLERLIEAPRHVEFQIVADKHGNVRHLFERDCSVQRRHQKVIEEAPAPAIAEAEVLATAQRVAECLADIGYDNIGTVEMLYDDAAGFNFLEVNTRLQVEHAVTEEISGVDIVQSQIRLAAGDLLAQVLPGEVTRTGHAIQARIYAEDPVRFLPSPGPLNVFRPPAGEGIRVETGYREGNVVTPHYDPMIAKVVARAPDRMAAIDRLAGALDRFEIAGVKTNTPFVLAVLRSDEFRRGHVHTGLAAEIVRRTTPGRAAGQA
jgi:acetyl-CoA carboxylase, biotin carboxylase subunit